MYSGSSTRAIKPNSRAEVKATGIASRSKPETPPHQSLGLTKPMIVSCPRRNSRRSVRCFSCDRGFLVGQAANDFTRPFQINGDADQESGVIENRPKAAIAFDAHTQMGLNRPAPDCRPFIPIPAVRFTFRG